MYIPKINLMTDRGEITEFMKNFSFATIITSENDVPTATHLPFVVEVRENNTIVLYSHFAKANPQWKNLEQKQILVIFSGPHAYISTENYEQALNVPTWNYVAVHAYGSAKIIENQTQLMQLLEHTIHYYDKTFENQWANLPNDYKNSMANGIIGFEIQVSHIEAKKKLSQNKSTIEKNNIIQNLSSSNDSSASQLADYMRKEQH